MRLVPRGGVCRDRLPPDRGGSLPFTPPLEGSDPVEDGTVQCRELVVRGILGGHASSMTGHRPGLDREVVRR